MGKRSETIALPDGRKTKINKIYFNKKEDALSFKKKIGAKRVSDFGFNFDKNQYVVRYYRDTKLNRELFGFKQHIPNFTPKESYWR